MTNSTNFLSVKQVAYLLLIAVLIFLAGYIVGMTNHNLVYINNVNNTIGLKNANVLVETFNGTQGEYIPNFHGNSTKFAPDLVCMMTYNSIVGYSAPYNCVK